MHVFYIYKTDKENKTIEIHELEILLFRCSASTTKAPTALSFASFAGACYCRRIKRKRLIRLLTFPQNSNKATFSVRILMVFPPSDSHVEFSQRAPVDQNKQNLKIVTFNRQNLR